MWLTMFLLRRRPKLQRPFPFVVFLADVLVFADYLITPGSGTT